MSLYLGFNTIDIESTTVDFTMHIKADSTSTYSNVTFIINSRNYDSSYLISYLAVNKMKISFGTTKLTSTIQSRLFDM